MNPVLILLFFSELKIPHSRPQSLRFFWSRGRTNGGLLVDNILRRVALGTRMKTPLKFEVLRIGISCCVVEFTSGEEPTVIYNL